MHPVVQDFLHRPTSHKVGLWVVTLLLIGGGFWQFSISEKITTSGKLDEEVRKLETDIATERRLASRLDKAREKLKDLQGKLQNALDQLPDKSEVDDLLDQISGIARESGLELNLFQRKEENFKEFYAEVPVSVSVSGTYHQVATFFDEVGRLSRIVNINQIQIFDPKPTDVSVPLKVDCMLTAFRYLTDAERATRAPVDKKKRK